MDALYFLIALAMQVASLVCIKLLYLVLFTQDRWGFNPLWPSLGSVCFGLAAWGFYIAAVGFWHSLWIGTIMGTVFSFAMGLWSPMTEMRRMSRGE